MLTRGIRFQFLGKKITLFIPTDPNRNPTKDIYFVTLTITVHHRALFVHLYSSGRLVSEVVRKSDHNKT
jgi:hypothetical protein